MRRRFHLAGGQRRPVRLRRRLTQRFNSVTGFSHQRTGPSIAFLPGFYRVFTGFTDSALKLLLGFPSTGTLLPSFTGFFLGSLTQLSSCWQVSHQRESFYWAVQVFTGFYWVLLGFTGFYWVEKRFLIKGSTSIGIYRVELG